jgi:alpha-tubulin suppressor-like RCC1 family protein
VGANHVLAIDFDAQVYSWGSGAFGRLGHGDFDNRYFPTLIEYFKPYYVEQCSAGDAHSALLTTSRKITRNIQIKKIVTFGRNGHGRLGNGKTNHSCQPVSVNLNLPSLVNLQCHQVVCGGAHTMALFFKHVPISLVRTYGLETYVVAWG